MVTERRNRRRHFLLRGGHLLRIEHSDEIPRSRSMMNLKASPEKHTEISRGSRTPGPYWHHNWPGSVTLSIRGQDPCVCDGSIDVTIHRPFAWVGTSVQSDLRLVNESTTPFQILVVWTTAGVALFEFRPQPASLTRDHQPFTQKWFTRKWWQANARHKCGHLELAFTLPKNAVSSRRISSVKTPAITPFLESGPELALVPQGSRNSSLSLVPNPNSPIDDDAPTLANSLAIRKPLTIVGDHPLADWQLPTSARPARSAHFLSPWQAVIIRDVSALGVISLNQLAPVCVNGHAQSAALLEVGDRVSFGGSTVYEVVVNPEVTTAAEVLSEESMLENTTGMIEAISSEPIAVST